MTTNTEPAYDVGDTVQYMNGANPDTSCTGKVLKVIPIITYMYEVEWSDGDPTDLYSTNQLKPV